MNPKSVKTAEVEAKRFLEAISKVEKSQPDAPSYGYNTSKETGALRRASLDLTRALAEMRKP